MEILKTLRKEKRLTQEELAKSLGISRLMVNQYESGKSMPGRNTLVKMAEFFNCTLDYLLGDNHEIERNILCESIKTTKQANKFEFFKIITDLKDESKELFRALSVMSKEEIDFFKLVMKLNEQELEELTTFIDFLISKREKQENEQRN